MAQILHLPPQYTDESGIKNYYWPIPFKDIQKFGRELEYRLAQYLREYPDQEDILSYKVLIKHYVCEVCGLFQGDILREGTKDIEVKLEGDWLFFPYTQKKYPPPFPQILQNLKKSKAAPSLLQRLNQPKRILKVLKNLKFSDVGQLKIDHLYLSKITSDNIEKNIITTQRTEIISLHAKNISEKVFLCASQRWFSEVTKEDVLQATSLFNNNIANEILEIIRALYKECGVQFEQYAHDYLLSLMKKFHAVITVHRNRLKVRNDIPRHIWTGTSGNIWDMMLRLETLSRGGRVVAHDHSGDRAHAKNFEMGWIEMYGATAFATFSEKQAEALRNNIKEWPVLDKNPPEIIAVQKNVKNNTVAKSLPVNDIAGKPKKILLFSTVYDRDRGRGNPIFSMVPYIDWQIRLVSHLKEWGYDVYMKPHPESPLMPPQILKEKWNVKIIEGRFEDMKENMDLYFFDFTQTSVFKPAILSGKPIVMVDFKGLEWNEAAKESLEKRVEIVNGYFDSQNRIQADWSEIEMAILNSTSKSDNQEFIEKFYI